ncbi:MAG: diacylglycerol kinase family protein [Balneolaceae bacterium]
MKKSSTRVCFIVNPAADRYRSVRHVDWLNREAKKRWACFEIIISPENQPVSELAAEKAGIFDIIVACGGDGTVNQVVNGIAGTGAALGIIPIGSGNDFVKTLYKDTSLAACMEAIAGGKMVSADLISCRGDVKTWCINTLGIGLDGLANYHAKSYRRLRGSVIYVLGALKAVFGFRGSRMSLTIDGEKLNGKYLMVTACNGKWEGGGFLIAPGANPFDGSAELVIIKKMSVAGILSYLPRFWLGFSKSIKAVKTYRCETVEIHSNKPVAAHCDGEHLGENLQHFKLAIVPGAIKIIKQ